MRSLVSGRGSECIAQLEDIARRGDMGECMHVAEALFSLGKENGRPALVRMLRSENPNARYWAAAELASTLESRDLLEVRSLLDDADVEVRSRVLVHLISAGDTALTPRLIEQINDESFGNHATALLCTLFRSRCPDYERSHERSYQQWTQWWADNKETARLHVVERTSWPK